MTETHRAQLKPIVEHTTCIVVGGGPAGALLAYMFAHSGIPVTLLESHRDFDRDYRGDTLHPSILEIMDELGLADDLLKLPHVKLDKLTSPTPAGPIEMGSFTHLKTKFPYIALMHQRQFLDFVTTRAKEFPCFHLVMGARVDEIVESNGKVIGVRYRGVNGIHELHALLTVGADGRYSTLRKLGGFTAIKTAPSIDLLWFRLSRRPNDPHGLMGRFGNGHVLIQLDRDDMWQCGFSIPKGSYGQLRAAGLESLRETITGTAPEFDERISELHDWKQISLLSIQADYVTQWHKPGLLLIGDAAHVMSPVGGNGINYAIQDAVVTANLLTSPIKAGTLSTDDLAQVQLKRRWAVKTIQTVVGLIHQVLPIALEANKRFTKPNASFQHFGANFARGAMTLARPFINALIIPVIAFGISPVHVTN
jgi:2-polyprenyl-6-methoxyphenol hydroxylase-like FAD-dependent oxidoreductase